MDSLLKLKYKTTVVTIQKITNHYSLKFRAVEGN